MQPTSAVYSEGNVVVPAQNEADSLYNDGYGSRLRAQLLTLEPFEVLYLVERERILVVDEEARRTLSFQELLSIFLEKDQLTWNRYVVYRDLRSRGFVAKPSKEDCLLVYERGTFGKKPPAWRVYTVAEGTPETIGHLEKIRGDTKKDGLELKLAVVDRRGELVYYGLSELDLSKLSGEDAE